MSDCWSTLSQETILSAVESVMTQPLANLVIQRNSYINRVYELITKETRQPLIAKFYRPNRWTKQQILEEHLFLLKASQLEIPVIEPLIFGHQTLFSVGDIFFALFPKKGGRALDEFDKEGWITLGRLLGRFHALSQTQTTSSRLRWDPQKATKKHLDILFSGQHMSQEYRTSLENSLTPLHKNTHLFSKEPYFLIHGDCHKGNLIHRPEEGIYLIDFDDCALGPAIQDLWMLLPGTAQESQQEINWFLEGYRIFKDFNPTSLKLLPYLTVMRIIHFASWCALQSNDVGFKEKFSEWGTTQYWNGTIREIQKVLTEE